jgi:hypothetical protein
MCRKQKGLAVNGANLAKTQIVETKRISRDSLAAKVTKKGGQELTSEA